MKRLALCAALAALLAVAAFGPVLNASAATASPAPAVQQWHANPQETAAADSGTLHARAYWAVLGVAVGCAVFGVFYLMRRRAGHFANPTWIAPISVMYSKDFPESFGDAPAESHGSHH